MQKGKVSVVVPIYKVEMYLNRCLDSIINQTYSDLEIILVDDGSPDSCGEIADDYQAEDDRIKVFHKKNGGLSDARNYGMKHVTSEYIMFVDSDDWLDLNMIELMVNNMVDYQADVVQSAFYYAHDDYLLYDTRSYPPEENVVVMEKKQLMHELVDNKRVKNFAWGKLYKTNLIKDIPFKKGVFFEDVFWAHKVMDRVNTYVLLNKPFYNYYQRDDSIVAAYSLKNLDFIRGLKERHQFIQHNYPELVNQSYRMLLKANLEHYYLLLLNRKKDSTGYNRNKIKNYIEKNHNQFIISARNEHQLYRQLMFFRIHPYLNLFYLAVRKSIRKVKIIPANKGLKRINL
ncbi:glycosyltransferase family 2 protein [Virgibacillus sp. C22-A2]|uniref:Glycosyltransferase family 2 protein n=1 Tax=Virgibacillus tibetensis TaxID=3042313 RepID=A0ABU6KFE4_9BACI|nr:glycosyltransferase family 2 protein [Virgibacillus sp. C22-A2]